jgi:sugar phosphate permease
VLRKLTVNETPPRLTPAYQWIILSILWFSHIVYFLNYLTVGTLAPLIQPELGLSSAQIGFLCSAITIGSMAIQIPAGVWCDLIGAKWVMSLGLVLMGGASISMSWVHSYTSAFLLLMLLGVGIGCNQAPASKAIMTWFSIKGRATAMGVKQTGINIGGVLASILLPALALQFNSWRFSFRAAGFASLFSALLVFTFYKETYTSSEDSFRMPFLKRSFLYLLSQRDFLLICLSGILLMMTQYSFTTYFMLYATRVLNFPIHQSGALLGLAFGAGAFARIGWSLLSDYLLGGKRKPILILIGIVAAFTSTAFILLSPLPSKGLLYLLVILFGLTGIGWNAIYLTMVGEFSGKELTGIATGISFLFSNLGVVAGPPLFGYLIDVTGEYHLSWVFIGLCMAMVALLNKIRRKEKNEDEEGRKSTLATPFLKS